MTESCVVGFIYKPGMAVRLKALDIPATVTGCLINGDGLQYQVVWYWDGTRRCEWVHGFELI